MKKTLKKVLASIAAALSTPEAIKAEKSLTIIVLIRLAVLVPAAATAIGFGIKILLGG